jgi:hypothetical protein
MMQISDLELYELFLDTVSRCTSDAPTLTDEELLHNLFEEFDVGCHSFLHDDNLSRLLDAKLIDEVSLQLAKEIRTRWLAMQQRASTVSEIKSDIEWQELFKLCDRVKKRSESH